MSGSDDFGITASQEGVPVNRAADYQKVLDSRWRFMEVEMEIPFNIVLPQVVNAGAFYNEDTPILQHSLGFLPPFEVKNTNTPPDSYSGFTSFYSDTRVIYIRRQIVGSSTTNAVSITGILRVYNLPILEEFTTNVDLPSPSAGTKQSLGFRAVDGSVPHLGPFDQSSVGYSIDTTKKILSIHKHGLAYINPWVSRSANVTAIDTSTEILTLTNRAGADPVVDWVTTPGLASTYSPNDFTTYPGGLAGATTYYTIPVDSSHVKLAATYADALANNPINLTSTGALPGFLNGVIFPGSTEDQIVHNVGYPPTYLLAPVTKVGNTYTIGPLYDILLAYVSSTNISLKFKGIQSTFGGRFGYIILKDPAELVL